MVCCGFSDLWIGNVLGYLIWNQLGILNQIFALFNMSLKFLRKSQMFLFNFFLFLFPIEELLYVLVVRSSNGQDPIFVFCNFCGYLVELLLHPVEVNPLFGIPFNDGLPKMSKKRNGLEIHRVVELLQFLGIPWFGFVDVVKILTSIFSSLCSISSLPD